MNANPSIHLGPQEQMPNDYHAIILAGGLGTRLRSAVPDLPKCMAPIAGKPFLQHLIDYLLQQGVNHFIFSLGYMHEVILHFLQQEYPDLSYQIVLEDEPLGTGGAIQKACTHADAENLMICNGDTMFKVPVGKLFSFHSQHHADCTLALKPMQDFDRYGVVEIDANQHILSFKEKQHYEKGLINGGVYIIRKVSLLQLGLPAKFSFEKDYLEKYCQAQNMMGLIAEDYFIDIGIPEDFERANREF
jgi:D-glycero-alpha-D-manno-heptose 1-phosphate guanylyltransferase